ncbi:hypothetical protein BKA69DRAFT_493758 [Paraphysoderma sedebokerense]|nr:hypothetical protein BKA69DRAFT_493758 [Paraphysoderma sedebokerense]
MNFLVVIQTAVPPHPVPHSKWANSNFPEHRRTCQDDYILARMFAIQGRILSFVNSPYRKHTPATMQKYHALLTFFRARLPTSYEIDYDIIDPKQDQLPSNHIITVNLAYYAAVITLHRPMALSGLLKKETNTSYKLCIDAADSILRVIKWTKSINYPVNCALNTFSIFTGGTVYIMKSLDENREQSEIADDLEKLKEIIDYIDELSLMWNIADKQAFFLRSHLNDITKTKSLPSSSPPSSTGQPKTTPPSDIIKLIKKFPTVFSKSDMGFLCYLKYTLLKKGMDSWSGQKSTNGLSPTTMFGKNINKDKVNIDLSDSAESQDDSDDGGVADQDTSKGSDPASSGKKRKTMNSFPPSEQSSETVDVDAGNVHPSAADFGYSEESSQLRTESVMSNSSLNVNVQAHWQSSPSPPISGSFSTANASASKPSPPISADNNASTFTPPAAGGTINFDNLKKFMNRAGGKLDANDYDNFSKQFGSHFSQGQSNSNPLEIHSPPYGGSASESTQNVTSPNSPMHRGMYNGDQHAALSQPMDVYSQVPAVSPNSYSHSNSPSIQNVQYTSPTGQSHNVPSNMSYGLNLSSQNHSNISAPSQTVLGNPFNSMPNTSTASSPFNPMLSNLNMVNQMNMNSNLSFGTSRSPTHNPPSPLNPGNIQTLPQRCVPGNYRYGQYDNIGNNVPGTPNQYYVGHNVNGNEQPGRQNGTSLMNPPTVFSTMMTMPHY